MTDGQTEAIAISLTLFKKKHGDEKLADDKSLKYYPACSVNYQHTWPRARTCIILEVYCELPSETHRQWACTQ